MKVTGADKDIWARTLYGEARGEPVEGMIAVAWVIRNRAERPGWWGRDVTEVCTHASKGVHQFSCWNAKDSNSRKLRAVTIADRAFRACLQVVDNVAAGLAPGPTNGSTHYHTAAVRPAWSRGLKPAAKIGNHLFFNNVR